MEKLQPFTYQNYAKTAVKRVWLFTTLISAAGVILWSLVLAPLYLQLASDYRYQGSLLVNILGYLLDIVDATVFFVTFPALIYGLWRGGLRGSWPIWTTASLTVLLKYILNFIMTCITDGFIPSWHIFINEDLPLILPNILIELGQYLVIMLLALLFIYGKKRQWKINVLIDGKAAGDERSLAFPFTKVVSFKNPLQGAAFVFSILYFLFWVYQHLLYQLVLAVNGVGWDGPVILITDLISDLLLSSIAYFVMLLLLSYYDRKELTAMAEASQRSPS